MPITLEAGYSATSGEQHARVIELINARRRLPITAEVEQLAVALQASLWNGGLLRAAGVNDLVIAATAIVHGAVVLHYDADYEHYDALFVAAARALEAPLISMDRRLLAADLAETPATFASRVGLVP